MLAIGGGWHGGVGRFQVDQMRDCVQDVEGHVIPACGHWAPEALNALVMEFLTCE